jgi:hypothetical protein
MRSWGVDRKTGDTAAADAELAVSSGTGIDNAGGVSDIAVIGGLNGCPKRSTVATGPRLPLVASILGANVAGEGVDVGKSVPGWVTGGSRRAGAVE